MNLFIKNYHFIPKVLGKPFQEVIYATIGFWLIKNDHLKWKINHSK